jgi:hypothetical protein
MSQTRDLGYMGENGYRVIGSYIERVGQLLNALITSLGDVCKRRR